MRYLIAFLLWSFVYVVIAQVDCPNTFDNNDDGAVTINDLLDLLVVFGDSDSDSDGIWDSVDACVNLSACNYVANPTETCVFIDALGACGGDCLGDADGDGLCDDVDDCVGEVDECGVCNGPGATEVVIESITLLYDSVYLPQLAAWYVYEYDADTAFTYVCPNLFQSCGDLITHEGYDYSTVLIGGQCWFSENCRYLPEVSPSSEGSQVEPFYYIYGYEGSDVDVAKSSPNFETYGVLYNWSAVMTEGICPVGWHIPSDIEWQIMEVSLGMTESEAAQSNSWRGSPVGNDLKSTTGWSENTGFNSSGFNGFPGSNRYWGGFASSLGSSGFWWSASQSDALSWSRLLSSFSGAVYRESTSRDAGFSARCIIDYVDDCGVLNGGNASCADCCGVPNGDGSLCNGACGPCNDDTSCLDACGVPNGDNSSCTDCCGVPNGDGSTCNGACGSCNDDTSCLDACGVPNGDNSSCTDCCGVPNGDGSTCNGACGSCNDDTSCLDACGVPNGDGASCAFICGQQIEHEGYNYSTIQIGDDCWFSENCRYLPSVSPPAPGSESTPFYYVYGYDGTSVAEAKATSNYVLFGALYNWPAAMGGACPSGWHIPTDSDWTHVTNLFGGEMVAGDAMKSNNYWNDGGSNGGNGSNLSGFNGRPGGLRNFNNDVPGSQGFFPLSGLSGYYGDFWSSTPTEMTGYFEGTVWGRVLNFNNPEVMRNVPRKHLGYSARCVLD